MSIARSTIIYVLVVIFAIGAALFIAVTPIDPKPPQEVPPDVTMTTPADATSVDQPEAVPVPGDGK